MSREDMLRELELLPVWTLRAPAPVIEAKRIDSQESEIAISERMSAITETDAQAPDTEIHRHIFSEDGDYLLVLPSTQLEPDEAILLRNIFIAMRIKTKTEHAVTNTLTLLGAHQPKVMIAMGESVAQDLLQTQLSIGELRGAVQDWQGAHLITTYDLNHLLKNWLDKSKAWDDLCLAMQTYQRLKSSVQTQSIA